MDKLSIHDWNDIKNHFSMENSDSEWKDLCYFLMYLWIAKITPFPKEIVKVEPPLPDFRCNFHDMSSIGLEHTNATTQNYMHADAKSEDGERMELSSLGQIEHDKDIVNSAIIPDGQQLNDSGYGDYGEEKAWIQCVVNSVIQKTKKKYSGFSNIELLVVDMRSPFVGVREEIALPELQKRLDGKEQIPFSKIHIMNASRLLYDVVGECRNIDSTPSML